MHDGASVLARIGFDGAQRMKYLIGLYIICIGPSVKCMSSMMQLMFVIKKRRVDPG